jgi:hypothetical protein
MAHRFAVLLMLFISLTEHRSSEERQRIACVCAISVSAALLIAHIGGSFWLKFFDIGIDWLQNQGNWTKLTHFQVSKRLPMKSMISVAID